jgi:hypothetical protein
MPEIVALDRDALYYPYIHIHDVNWLKSTLLCFPSVHRILPDAYAPQGFTSTDSEEIKQFCRTEGARGPLLQPSKSVHDSAPANAADGLQRRIQANEEFFVDKYSQTTTIGQLGNHANQFKLHDSKVSYYLIRYLESKDLAWRGPDREWIIMHPRLGTAVMSVISLAIAKSDGLDIVTPSDRTHYFLSLSDDNQIFTNLLEPNPASVAPRREDLTDDLAEVVMTTLFDVSRLTPDQIAELQKDGKDLRQFKRAVASIAAQIPDIANPEARWTRLKEASEQVVEEWNAYRKGLPRFLAEALIDATEIKPPEWSAGFLAGASAHHVFGLGLGIVIGVLTYSGTKVLRTYRAHRNSPYRYLTRIYKEGATLKTPTSALTYNR